MAHAAPTAPRRHHRMTGADIRHVSKSALTVPLLMGLVYGVWAAFINRQMGPVDAGNVFYGILCGVVFAGCVFALARYGSRLVRELHAAAWGAFAGIALGYLYSQTNESVLRSAGIGLAVGVATTLAAFYHYHSIED
ncbi:hypothetical protein ACIA6C_20570 [Streptomyces sp. NPDC051578]|uniref:hypothetical protein n=1 Tax=Streptomyces sp. NPDC051578 TaxID=3365662 RepID=UPI0037938778